MAGTGLPGAERQRAAGRHTKPARGWGKARGIAQAVRNGMRRAAEAVLRRVDDDVASSLPLYLGWSVALTVLVVGVLHLTLWWTLSVSSVMVQVVGVGLGMVVATSSLLLLAWVYVQIHVDPEDHQPFLVAGLASAATLGVCSAGFAALTTLLIDHSVIDTAQQATPGLTDMEVVYLWHLVDAVPFLGVTRALNWQPPVPISDPVGGALLLVFKVLLLVPLIRVLLAGFGLVLATVVKLGGPSPTLGRPRRTTGLGEEAPLEDGPSWTILDGALSALFVVTWTAGAYALLEFVVGRSSFVDGWVARVPDTVDGFGLEVSTSWLPMALDVVGAWGVVAMAWAIVDESVYLETFVREHSRSSTLGVAGLVLWIFGLSVLGAAAVTITLLHAGLASSTRELAATNEVGVTLEWFCWHLVDAIPLLDVTHTLGWTLDVEYVDRWTGVVLVLMRALMVAVLLLPFVVVSRVLVAQAAGRKPPSPHVNAVRDFAGKVAELQASFDATEARLRRFVGGDGSYAPPRVIFDPGNRGRRDLEATLERVEELLGDGPAHEAGVRVVLALVARAGALAEADREVFFAGRNPERSAAALAGLKAARANVAAALLGFHRGVLEAFTEPSLAGRHEPPAGQSRQA